jgi:hypothetical protein
MAFENIVLGQFARDLNKNNTPHNSDEPLSLEQALLFQEYATKLENIEFSIKASDESYEEAKKLLDKLKDSGFSWLNIDWDKIDLNNIGEIKDIEKRLSDTAKEIIKSQQMGFLEVIRSPRVQDAMKETFKTLLSTPLLPITMAYELFILFREQRKAEKDQNSEELTVKEK